MSKSLNFVVSIKLDRRSSDANGNHLLNFVSGIVQVKLPKCTVATNFRMKIHSSVL